MSPTDWVTHALCAYAVRIGEAQHEDWHAPLGTPQVRRALRICGECSAAPACLAWAVEHREYGVWAGTTDSQRETSRRNKRRPNWTPRFTDTQLQHMAWLVQNGWTHAEIGQEYDAHPDVIGRHLAKQRDLVAAS